MNARDIHRLSQIVTRNAPLFETAPTGYEAKLAAALVLPLVEFIDKMVGGKSAMKEIEKPGRITFRCEGSGRLILVEMSEEEGLPYVLERFAEFLRAVGFKVDGELDVVKEE